MNITHAYGNKITQKSFSSEQKCVKWPVFEDYFEWAEINFT